MTPLPTYRLTLYFEGKDGRTKKVHEGMEYGKAMGRKTAMLEKHPACVEAYLEPERGKR
jgi:hypothetical protein